MVAVSSLHREGGEGAGKHAEHKRAVWDIIPHLTTGILEEEEDNLEIEKNVQYELNIKYKKIRNEKFKNWMRNGGKLRKQNE